MYQPAHARFVEERREELERLIRDYPLGTLIAADVRGIDVTHVPVLIDGAKAPMTLTAHLPRANPTWRILDGKSVVVVFHGPDAYISPSWYAAKRVHGKVVPTWNYAVVHVHGVARVIEDRDWLRKHLEEMTAVHESALAHPWKVSDAPADYIDNLLNAIVGLEIIASRVEGKFKLGQHRSPEDQRGVIAGLAGRGPIAGLLAELSATRLPT